MPLSDDLSQNAQDGATWTAKHVRGPKVAFVGCLLPATLAALARERHPITAYVSDPSSLEEWLESQVGEDQDMIDLHCLPDFHVDELSMSVNTVAVLGFPNEIGGPAGFLRRMRRSVSAGTRLVLVLPNFSNECSRDDGFSIESFIGDARLLLSPVHLSVADDVLRFVGDFGVPTPNAWIGFEASVWPGLLRDGVRSIAERNRREVAGLQQRLGRLRGLVSSMPYRVGTTVVAAAKKPGDALAFARDTLAVI